MKRLVGPLEMGVQYTVRMSSCTKEYHPCTIDQANMTFTTLSCLQVANYNYSICGRHPASYILLKCLLCPSYILLECLMCPYILVECLICPSYILVECLIFPSDILLGAFIYFFLYSSWGLIFFLTFLLGV